MHALEALAYASLSSAVSAPSLKPSLGTMFAIACWLIVVGFAISSC